jgi:hypothetical protein
VQTFTFDFLPNPGGPGTMVGVGETIVTQAWSLAALNGLDLTPSSRLIGSPQILAGTKVLQQIGTCVAGENYRVMATIRTSITQTLTLYAHCPCVAPS